MCQESDRYEIFSNSLPIFRRQIELTGTNFLSKNYIHI